MKHLIKIVTESLESKIIMFNYSDISFAIRTFDINGKSPEKVSDLSDWRKLEIKHIYEHSGFYDRKSRPIFEFDKIKFPMGETYSVSKLESDNTWWLIDSNGHRLESFTVSLAKNCEVVIDS